MADRYFGYYILVLRYTNVLYENMVIISCFHNKNDFNKRLALSEEFVYYHIIVCQAERSDYRILNHFLKINGVLEKRIMGNNHQSIKNKM